MPTNNRPNEPPNSAADTADRGPTRVLIIEDQVKIAHWLSTFLKDELFQVFIAPDGATGLRLARLEAPDVVILDLMLPDIDGLEICRTLRRESNVFILMLTARVEEADRLIGLESGADDYIVKPFSPREVIARIRALLRRANGSLNTGSAAHESHALPSKTLHYGALAIDQARHQCTLAGEPITLTPTEFALLGTLMRQPGIPFSRERLITEALGYDYAGYERTIDVHIRNLRRKLEPDSQNPIYILTVFGVGYRFGDH